MSKGSGRRKGEGYAEGWDRIFAIKDKPPVQPQQIAECTEPFCQCEEGKCVWRKFDAEDDGK